MRSKLWLLAVGVCLALLSAAVIGASTLTSEEADLFPYSDPYEVNRGPNGEVYVSDTGVGVWRVAASGTYTLYRLLADVLDARPDSAGDVWYTDGANLLGRVNVDEVPPTRTTWVLEATYGLYGLTFDDVGRVWFTQESGPNLFRFDPTTTEVCTYTLEAWSTYVLHDGGTIWLADWGADRIRRLSAAGQVTSWSIPWSGARPLGLVLDGEGDLWWADRGLAALVRLEAGANRITRYDLPVGTRPQVSDLRAGQVWYSEWTLNVPGTVGVLDPALATGISTTVVPATTSVTPQCAVLGPGATSPVPQVDVGSLDWISATLVPVHDQDGWTIYELPALSRPYGLTSAGAYVWLADRGRKKLVRLSPGSPPTPAIDLEKLTNGQDADAPPGPQIAVGDPVTWTYVVTNTGNVDLTGVTVVDDNGTPTDPVDDYTCDIGLLPAGATDDTTCSQPGVAQAGPYENQAQAQGFYGSTPVADSDLSHYTGVAVSIDLEKLTNGQDADAAPGPVIPVGDPVLWTYVVTNTGEGELVGVTLVDDNGTPGDPTDDYTCNIGVLPPGGVDDETCSQMGTAEAGQYANLALVVGFFDGALAQDADPSHYFGASGAIDLEKSTNGEDADAPPGPIVPVGEVVSWTYVVTNAGDVALTDIVVMDDQGVAVSCPQTSLAVGESMACTASGTATAGQYANLATADGLSGATPVVDVDASHYFGANVSIDVEKYTNGEDADDPPGPELTVGSAVLWTYRVINTGDVDLAQVVVVDDNGTPANPADDSVCPIGILPAGATDTSCSLAGAAVVGQYENLARAEGYYGAYRAQDQDASHYLGVEGDYFIFLPLVMR